MRTLGPIVGLLVGGVLAAGCNQPTPEAAAFEALRRLDGCVHDRDVAGARMWAVRSVRWDSSCRARAAALLEACEALQGTSPTPCVGGRCWLHVPGARRAPAREGRPGWWPCHVTLNFPETDLREAIELVASSTGLVIELDPRAGSDRTVSLRLKDIPVDDALKLIADQTCLRALRVADRVLLFVDDVREESAVSELLLPAGP